ncbi:hypothetical protein Pelo_4687 [Pelomyxa schiedti]|nr:hypothetical protein Pelo_4687 [Pelomyxa schiedti]
MLQHESTHRGGRKGTSSKKTATNSGVSMKHVGRTRKAEGHPSLTCSSNSATATAATTSSTASATAATATATAATTVTSTSTNTSSTTTTTTSMTGTATATSPSPVVTAWKTFAQHDEAHPDLVPSGLNEAKKEYMRLHGLTHCVQEILNNSVRLMPENFPAFLFHSFRSLAYNRVALVGPIRQDLLEVTNFLAKKFSLIPVTCSDDFKAENWDNRVIWANKGWIMNVCPGNIDTCMKLMKLGAIPQTVFEFNVPGEVCRAKITNAAEESSFQKFQTTYPNLKATILDLNEVTLFELKGERSMKELLPHICLRVVICPCRPLRVIIFAPKGCGSGKYLKALAATRGLRYLCAKKMRSQAESPSAEDEDFVPHYAITGKDFLLSGWALHRYPNTQQQAIALLQSCRRCPNIVINLVFLYDLPKRQPYAEYAASMSSVFSEWEEIMFTFLVKCQQDEAQIPNWIEATITKAASWRQAETPKPEKSGSPNCT